MNQNVNETIWGSSKTRDENIYVFFSAETRSLEKQKIWICGTNNCVWMR